MSWMRGVFRCDTLGVDDCVVWWDAIGAVGTWLAAAVTFLAVLLPHLASRRREAVSTKVALVDLELALKDFKRRLHHAHTLMSIRDGNNSWFSIDDWEAMRLPPITHAVQASKNAEDLLVHISLLRVAVNEWNGVVDLYAKVESVDPAGRRSVFDHLERQLRKVATRFFDASLDFKSMF